MKILFFSPTSAGYSSNNVSHNGGGWIVALAKKMISIPAVELAIAFEGSGIWNDRKNGICYYPISISKTLKNRLYRKISLDFEVKVLLPEMQKVILAFQPDIIYIFGSENAFGKICEYTEIPCIIHLQGFLPSYYNAKFPPGISSKDFSWELFRHPFQTIRFFWFDKVFQYRAKREIRIIQKCHNFLGRTDWDRSIVRLFHPEAEYFYGSEILRDVFYIACGQWAKKERKFVTFISVLSSPLYKGHDLILKTAKLLVQYTKLDFQWKVFGSDSLAFFGKKMQIVPEEVHVISCGVASAEELKVELLAADIFIHPSYIDNSPNSICEAQLIGLPIIAVNVGGVASLIEHRQNGVLVPANDPVAMADWIVQLCHDSELCRRLGKNAADVARERHDPETVVAQVMNACQHLYTKGNNEKE